MLQGLTLLSYLWISESCYISNDHSFGINESFNGLQQNGRITFTDLMPSIVDKDNYTIIIFSLPAGTTQWYLNNISYNLESTQNNKVFSGMTKQNGDNIFEMENITINVLKMRRRDLLTYSNLQIDEDNCITFTLTRDDTQGETGNCVLRKVKLLRRCYNKDHFSFNALLKGGVINRDHQCFNFTLKNAPLYKNCIFENTELAVPLVIQRSGNTMVLTGCNTFEKDMNVTLCCDTKQISFMKVVSYKELVVHDVKGQMKLISTNPILKKHLKQLFADSSTNVKGMTIKNSVVCDLTGTSLHGLHRVIAIRSSELAEATLQYQLPIEIYFDSSTPRVETMFNLDTLQLTVYSTQNISLTCTWNDSAEVLTNKCNDTISLSRFTLQNHSLTLTSCHESHCFKQVVTVSIPKYVTLKVDVYGIPQTSISSNRIVLYAGISLNGYNDDLTIKNAQYSWYLNSIYKAKTQTFIIKGNTYRGGDKVTVKLNVTANCNGMIGQGSTEKIIEYALQPLVAVTDSYQRSLSQGRNLYIDASKSYNPNWPYSEINHHWSCWELTGNGTCGLDDSVTYNESLLEVDASFLVPGQRFIDYITDGFLNSSLATIVTIQPRNAPTVKLLPSSQIFVNFIDSVRTQALVFSSGGHLDTEWHLFESETNTSIDVSSHFPHAKRSFDNVDTQQPILLSFTLAPGSNVLLGLSSNKSYVIRLLAKNSAGIGWGDRLLKPRYMPLNLKVRILSEATIFALETPVTFELVNESINLSNSYIRFGFRTVSLGNLTFERWSRFSALMTYTTYFPSTITNNADDNISHCNTRVSYKGLVELCDFYGYCVRGETQAFVVEPSRNFKVAYDTMTKMMDTDLKNGALHNAMDKLLAICQENCTSEVHRDIFDILALKMITQLSSSSDVLELMEGMQYLNNVILWSSPHTMNKISDISAKVKYILGLENNRRRKRNTDLMTAMAFGSGSRISEDMADELLRAYDLLISKNQQSETLYLSNIDDLLSAFCVQTDSNNMMEASGGKYTDIKLQALVPSYDSFLNESYSMAGNSGEGIEFKSNFKIRYSEWKCSNGNVSCSEICLGTAQIKHDIFDDNEFMRAAFSSPVSSAISIYDLVSDLHRIIFMDPINGQDVQLDNYIKFTVKLPVENYSSAVYYKCLMYTDTWSVDLCVTADYAVKTEEYGYLLQCECKANGYVGVFKVPAPTPPHVPFYNEIGLQLSTTQSGSCTIEQARMIINSLATVASVEETRFVNVTSCTNMGTFSAILRPALKQNQTSNSYVVQAIRKTVQQPGGFAAGDNITIDDITTFVIERDLLGDGNARRLSLRIDKTLKEIAAGNPDQVAQQWVQGIASGMRISEFRFKNPELLIGVMFNFTITLPFPGEISEEKDLSAELICFIIQEQIEYNELELRDKDGQILPIDPFVDIYQLVVAEQLNTLVIVLGVLNTIIVTLGGIMAGGLVIIKIRTDKLIQAHNREFDEQLNVNNTERNTDYCYPDTETILFK